jgi:hypothetical protein
MAVPTANLMRLVMTPPYAPAASATVGARGETSERPPMDSRKTFEDRQVLSGSSQRAVGPK